MSGAGRAAQVVVVVEEEAQEDGDMRRAAEEGRSGGLPRGMGMHCCVGRMAMVRAMMLVVSAG